MCNNTFHTQHPTSSSSHADTIHEVSVGHLSQHFKSRFIFRDSGFRTKHHPAPNYEVKSCEERTLINRPPVDAIRGRRPLEIRAPHNLHIQNLKKKMKINPHATVGLENKSKADFDVSNPKKYQYFVLGGSHSTEA